MHIKYFKLIFVQTTFQHFSVAAAAAAAAATTTN
jgi:hypothetical protein